MIGFDPHEILEVSLDADVNTIKKSYRKLALLYHPDRNVGNPVAAAKFIQISKAYECLTD
jgi:molecular chaperone DnaJ